MQSRGRQCGWQKETSRGRKEAVKRQARQSGRATRGKESL
jgi:hypothetical protein